VFVLRNCMSTALLSRLAANARIYIQSAKVFSVENSRITSRGPAMYRENYHTKEFCFQYNAVQSVKSRSTFKNKPSVKST
jgi:hypothetical protein